jgi:hypothetical protein
MNESDNKDPADDAKRLLSEALPEDPSLRPRTIKYRGETARAALKLANAYRRQVITDRNK